MATAAAQLTTEAQYKPIPQYRSTHPLGTLAELRNDKLGTFLRACQRHGDVVRMQLGPQPIVLVRHPHDVQRVLLDNHRNYSKQTRGYRMLRMLLGSGLVTSEGELWLRQRRIAQPAFHRERLAAFVTTMTDSAHALLQRWEPRARAGDPIELAHEMMRLTLAIVGRTLLSRDVSDAADGIGEAITIALKHSNYRLTHLLSLPEWIPTPRNLRFRSAVATLDRIVADIITERRGRDAGDLLSMLMAARDEVTGEGMSDKQLRDEVMTIFLAGHETTAMTLTWTLYLLATHPEVEHRLRAEVAAALAGRPPTLADLKEMPLCDRVIKESLRLYPPVWIMGRNTEADDVLSGHLIRKGTYLFVSQFLTHRHPAFWETPERFDPDRFLPERFAALPRFAYFPFSGGQRKCIGDQFAIIEANLLLPMILQRFTLSPCPGQQVAAEPLVTLRPRHGLRMIVHPAPFSGRRQ